MRIVGGQYRGRKLDVPQNNDIRPTSDKIRQAVFNMLKARGLVQGAIVLDGFCGTGALGLLALSQGAAQAVFFDTSKASVRLTKRNIEGLGVGEQSHVFYQDCTKAMSRPEEIPPIDLVFLDPPYHQEMIPKAIESLYQAGWFSSDVTILMEMAKDEEVFSPFTEVIQEKIYGDTKIILGQRL